LSEKYQIRRFQELNAIAADDSISELLVYAVEPAMSNARCCLIHVGSITVLVPFRASAFEKRTCLVATRGNQVPQLSGLFWNMGRLAKNEG
jgi:hypothetical protein